MGCHAHAISLSLVSSRCCPDEALLLSNSIKPNLHRVSVASNSISKPKGNQNSNEKWRIFATPVSLQEQSSSEFQEDDEDLLPKTPTNDQLKSLLADSQRSILVKKLSEANQHNRFLKRQLQGREDTLVNFKSELAVLEQELQALVSLADEISKAGIPEGTRKIKGKYIHSHLVSRLEAVQQKLHDQIKDVAAVQSKEVPIFWIGMAESVEVMGSFDGWSQGEHLSPEFTSSYTKFSTTLFLRPGRYEIKFLVDGEWLTSPEFPTVGEGLTRNNLLVVE